MKTIYKYALENVPVQQITLPFNSQIISVQAQLDRIVLWAIVWTENSLTDVHTIKLYETGKPIEDNIRFLGTCQLFNGNYILHAFEQ